MNKKITVAFLTLCITANLNADGFLDFLTSKNDNAKAKLSCINMNMLSSSLQMFRLDNNTYPTTEEGLESLIANPDNKKYTAYANGAYLKQIPLDGWGSAFIYANIDGKVEITSYGADKKEGGEEANKDIYFSKCEGK